MKEDKKETEEIKEPFPEEPEEKRISEEAVERLHPKEEEKKERKELLTEEEKVIREELEREIEIMKLSPQLQDDAQKKAQQIKDLDVKGKLKQLLVLAEEKGVGFAVEVAKNMKDPATLDTLHDILAKDGFYKKLM